MLVGSIRLVRGHIQLDTDVQARLPFFFCGNFLHDFDFEVALG